MLDLVDDNRIYAAALGMGAVSGLRAMIAPAIVSHCAHVGSLPLEATPLAFLASPAASYTLKALAAGEIFADKLPGMPARTAPFGLAARIVSGALCGAALCYGARRNPAIGAACGAVGAIGGAFGGYYARKALTAHIPDPAVACCEDAAAGAAGSGILCAL